MNSNNVRAARFVAMFTKYIVWKYFRNDVIKNLARASIKLVSNI